MVELNMAGKVNLVDGDDKEIMPGIEVFTGSRHTFNSQYVLDTQPNKIIIASDNIWIYCSPDHMVPPSPGGTLDPVGYVKAMQRIKTMVSDPKYVIPGCDLCLGLLLLTKLTENGRMQKQDRRRGEGGEPDKWKDRHFTQVTTRAGQDSDQEQIDDIHHTENIPGI